LSKFVDKYMSGSSFSISGEFSDNVFDAFCLFMDKFIVPSDDQTINGLFVLLNDMLCHESLLFMLKTKVFGLKKSTLIMRNNKQYMINPQRLLQCSMTYSDFEEANSGQIFCCNDSFDDEAFDVFLQIVHDEIMTPPIELMRSVQSVLSFYQCKYLFPFFRQDSIDIMIQKILSDNPEDQFSSEIQLAQELHKILDHPALLCLSMPVLCRLFQMSKESVPLSEFVDFLKKLLANNGSSVLSLIPFIKISNQSNSKEVIDLVSAMNYENGDSNLFFYIKSIISSNKLLNNSNDISPSESGMRCTRLSYINEFKGIIDYFNKKFDNDVYRNIIDATSSHSMVQGSIDGIFNDSNRIFGNSTLGSNIILDMKENKVMITHYTLQCHNKRNVCYLVSWDVDVSEDSTTWTQIHSVKDDHSLSGEYKSKTFPVSKQALARYIRITCHQSSGQTWSLSRFEMYGDLYEKQ